MVATATGHRADLVSQDIKAYRQEESCFDAAETLPKAPRCHPGGGLGTAHRLDHGRREPGALSVLCLSSHRADAVAAGCRDCGDQLGHDAGARPPRGVPRVLPESRRPTTKGASSSNASFLLSADTTLCNVRTDRDRARVHGRLRLLQGACAMASGQALPLVAVLPAYRCV